jgi:DNA-binding HxlR family transcriptional regulator
MNSNPEKDPKKSTLVRCEVEGIWGVLGKAWSLLILKNLSTKDVVRFNELKRILGGISSTVLSDRLAELEKEGLVSKKIYAEVPLRVEYSLTRQARDLEAILDQLNDWVKRWEPQAPKSKQK